MLQSSTMLYRITALILTIFASLTPLYAQTVPAGFTLDQVATLPNVITDVAQVPDGTGRLFVTLQSGTIRVIANNQLLPTPFITLPVEASNERGLLSIAFDPQFSQNGYLYTFYTWRRGPNDFVNLIARIQADPQDPNRALSGSLTHLIELGSAANGNHIGGGLGFGTDNLLYVGVGDAVTSANAQNLTNLHGKVLRLDPTLPNLIPPSNPYVGTQSRGEIWSNGFRNPFSLTVNRSSGLIYVNDVGAGSWEEINTPSRGGNYGWPTCEGPCSNQNFTNPVYAYPHQNGDCAIIGGDFYQPSATHSQNNFPAAYNGQYFFADYCNGWIRTLSQTGSVQPFGTGFVAVAISTGYDGNMYVAHRSGIVYRIRYTQNANRPPTARLSATPQTGPAPLLVSFDGSASSDPDNDPLQYSWDFGDGTPTQSGITITHTYNRGGTFNATLTVSDGRGGVHSNSLQITPGNRPPTATIITPNIGTTFRGGQTISFSGTGNDPEDGLLPATRFSWTIVAHHGNHTHPFSGPFTNITNGSFVAPTIAEPDHDIWYRIHLTVRDSLGVAHSVFRDVLPELTTVDLLTSPPGLPLTLDGQPISSPHRFQAVINIRRTIGAETLLVHQGVEYRFLRWSDSGTATHTIFPLAPSTYRAYFEPTAPRIATPATPDDLGQEPTPTPVVQATATPIILPTLTPSAESSPTPLPTPEPPTDLIPELTCIDTVSDGSRIIRFGVHNRSLDRIELPLGDQNYLSPLPANKQPPTSFPPGRTVNILSVRTALSSLTWTLGTNSVTVANGGPRCCSRAVDLCGSCGGRSRCQNPCAISPFASCDVCGNESGSCNDCIIMSLLKLERRIDTNFTRLISYLRPYGNSKLRRALSSKKKRIVALPDRIQSCSNSVRCRSAKIAVSIEDLEPLLETINQTNRLGRRVAKEFEKLGQNLSTLPSHRSICS